MGIVELFVAIEYGIFECKILKGILVLAEHSQFESGLKLYFPFAWFNLSGKNLHKGRFSRPVGTNKTVAFTHIESLVDLVEKYALSVTLC